MKLIEPREEYSTKIKAYREEYLAFGGSMDGTGNLRKMADPKEWIQYCRLCKNPATVPQGLVPATQYLYVREEDDKIVGMIQIRHYLNEYLGKFGGHIGYSVLPSERRKGYASKMLKEVLGEVLTDPTILDANCKDRPKAPGMRYRHYAPKGELTVVEGDSEAVIAYINRAVSNAREADQKTGVIATSGTADFYSADVVKKIGNREVPEEVAASLYRILREMDDENVEVIYSESFADDGLGAAIMNRLLKAAGHRKISV